ncbi:MAG: hypothetical protein K2Q01_12605 [Rickettsiales bacterium]|nr:hypothetical protein [Rickettsiales bacterium]
MFISEVTHCSSIRCAAVIGALCLCTQADKAWARMGKDTVYHSYQNPVTEFTRSMARMNYVSEMCKDVESADYNAYSVLIKQYVKILYRGETPYWVLTEVKERINDQTLCKWMVSESLIHYQFAYQDYVDVARPELLPPRLTESMSLPGHAPVDMRTLGIARPSKH